MLKYWIDWNNKFALSNCNLHVVPIFVFIFYSECKSLHLSSNISFLICILCHVINCRSLHQCGCQAAWLYTRQFVFTNSLIHERLESNHVFEDGYLLGDSGYSCKPFLMTPYPNLANAKQEAFNKAHCKTRVAIEQTFGRWKRRFHLLHSECRMKPVKVCTIIGACAVLHSISILLSDDIDDDPFDDDQPELVPYHGADQRRLLRDHICNTFF